MHFEQLVSVPSLEKARTGGRPRHATAGNGWTLGNPIVPRTWPNYPVFLRAGLTTLAVFAIVVGGVTLFLLQLAEHGW